MSPIKPNILIINDQLQAAESIQEIISSLKYKCSIVIKSTNIISHIRKSSTINLILLDVKMPKLNGEKVHEKISNMFPHIGIITLAPTNDLQIALQSLKNDAFNYLLKPINKQKLSLAITSYFSSINMTSISKINFLNHISNDPIFKKILHDLHVYSYKHEPIAILGETGTEKKFFAKIIHSSSTKKTGSLQTITLDEPNKINLDQKLKESKTGSLIILNFENLPFQEQAHAFHCLNSLKKGESPQIIFFIDTIIYDKKLNDENKHLFEQILKNKILLPPLRDRKTDILLLIQYFLIKYTSQYERYIPNIQDDVIRVLEDYSFPNNITEMEEIISSAVLAERSNELSLDSLPYHIKNQIPIEDNFQEVQFKAIQKALNFTRGNHTQAAKKLGMSRSTFNMLLKEYNDGS